MEIYDYELYELYEFYSNRNYTNFIVIGTTRIAQKNEFHE